MWWYEPSRRIEVKGGIKLQSKDLGKSWWSQLWIKAIEKFADSGRLARGKTYARKGQVISIDIKEGMILSKVQGSSPKPYDIKIKIEKLSDKDWTNIANLMSKEVSHITSLMSGQMPRDIEQIFKIGRASCRERV